MGKQDDLFVRLWGVRGSYPVPGHSFSKYGGNTSCVEVRTKNHLIILDAGTGIIELGEHLMPEIKDHIQRSDKPFVINILFSHTHHDHLMGLPYFAPAFLDECQINFYGTQTFSQTIEHVLAVYMSPQFSPIELNELRAVLNFGHISESNVLLLNGVDESPKIARRNNGAKETSKEATVSLLRNYAHPKIGTFCIKVAANGKSMVYATDTEGYVGNDTRLIRFSKNADLLIHDAQYDPAQYLETQGFGHSTYEMAAAVANAANIKNLVLFHHDPYHNDEKLHEMETQAKKLFENTTAGAEGQEFHF